MAWRVLQAAGSPAEALREFERALEIRPDFADAHYNLGIALYNRGEVDQAIAHYRKALEIEPDSVNAHTNLGNILAGRGELDKAVAQYQKALEVRPDFADAHLDLGNVLAEQGRVDESVAQFERALEINPDSAEAHYNIGNAISGRGRLDGAIAHYQRAIAIKPDYADAHVNLGNALARRGQFDEAIACYKRALQIKPDHAARRESRGRPVGAGKNRDHACPAAWRAAFAAGRRWPSQRHCLDACDEPRCADPKWRRGGRAGRAGASALRRAATRRCSTRWPPLTLRPDGTPTPSARRKRRSIRLPPGMTRRSRRRSARLRLYESGARAGTRIKPRPVARTTGRGVELRRDAAARYEITRRRFERARLRARHGAAAYAAGGRAER